jgi:hypothetical protein
VIVISTILLPHLLLPHTIILECHDVLGHLPISWTIGEGKAVRWFDKGSGPTTCVSCVSETVSLGIAVE